MNAKLNDLYAFPEDISDVDIYIEDLALHCRQLEDRIQELLENLSPEHRELLLSYLDLRDELEVYTVQKAIRYGSSHKIYKVDSENANDLPSF